MRRAAATLVLVALVAVAVALAARPSQPTSTPAVREARIAAGLRCPVCQGLSVADSPSDVAQDIRADIARRIAAGQTDAQIQRGYVDRYGPWILLRPPGRGISTLLWALPAAALIIAVSILAFALRRWQRQPALHPTAADQALVAEALARSGAATTTEPGRS